MVVVATCTALDRSPNMAAQVARRLGVPSPAALDVGVACSGFSHAIATTDHAIRAGAATNALVIGAEKLTDFADWTDRSTCVLIGDGAGAAVLTASDDPGVGPVVWGSVPEMSEAVRLRIIEPLAKRIGAVNAVVARDVVDSGNTSAASIPLALSKLIERREIPAGAPVLLFGFGGGLAYAGQIIRCP